MATILIHTYSEGGHVGPTLSTARKLKARGDRVIYFLEPAMHERLLEEGFEVIPYLEDRYPLGSRVPSTLEEWKERLELQWIDLKSGWFAHRLGPLNLDLIIYDVCRVEVGFAAHQMKVPSVQLNTTFPSSLDPIVPPSWSDSLPGEMSWREIEREWNIFSAVGPPFLGMERWPGTVGFAWQMDQCNLELGQITTGASGLMIDGDPKLIMTSAMLDYSEALNRDDCVYAGPCLGPPESTEWTLPGRRPDAPLIYCAFGGQSENYSGVRSFVKCLTTYCASRPDVDFILAGKPVLIENLELPENMHFMTWAPQRAILNEADLFITHGGHGSLKEAVWAGVPMLVCPQAYDQHGNASRVLYHGLGQRILEGEPSQETLGRHIEELLGNSKYKEKTASMGDEFRKEISCDNDLRLIDAVIDDSFDSLTSHGFHAIGDTMMKNNVGYLPEPSGRKWHERTWDVAVKTRNEKCSD